MTYITATNLATGQITKFQRESIPPELINQHKAVLYGLLDGKRVEWPKAPELEASATSVGQAMLCTLWRGERPILTYGIALKSRAGAKLWQTMADTPGTMMAPGVERPGAPYIAIKIDAPGLEDIMMMQQAERFAEGAIALAWAFEDLKKGEHNGDL